MKKERLQICCRKQKRNRSFFEVVHQTCTKPGFLIVLRRKAKTRKPLIFNDFRVARDKGFEPLTFWSVDVVLAFFLFSPFPKTLDFMRFSEDRLFMSSYIF